MMGVPLFTVLDVEKTYRIGTLPGSGWFSAGQPRLLKALNGVRLEIAQGDSIALVGESGSGKSTLVRLMLGLEPATDGRLLYRQVDIGQFGTAARQTFRREVAFIYQDARGSMNPRMRIRTILAEPLRLYRLCSESEVDRRVLALLEKVGLSADLADRYPSELSGGQVRRVAVARALAAEPKTIVADESVAGLDVSVQAQLLNLLRSLCREMGLTLIFITHDLGVASYLCTRIAVLYLGRIVEEGATADILQRPMHPYTQGLMRAFPSFGRPLTASLKGEIPSPIDLPAGCRFASRCPQAVPFCLTSDPVLKHPEDADPYFAGPLTSLSPLSAEERRVACHFPIRDILER